MVDALDLAELQGVDDEADVAILSEPRAVMLIRNFVPVTHAVLDHWPVTANVEDCRGGFGQVFRQIKIRGDIKSGQRLEVKFLDLERVGFNLTGDNRLQICLLRKGPKAEHFKQLMSILLAVCSPVTERLDVGEAPFVQLHCSRAEVVSEHLVASGQIRF